MFLFLVPSHRFASNCRASHHAFASDTSRRYHAFTTEPSGRWQFGARETITHASQQGIKGAIGAVHHATVVCHRTSSKMISRGHKSQCHFVEKSQCHFVEAARLRILSC
jgi:hypothetical protein